MRFSSVIPAPDGMRFGAHAFDGALDHDYPLTVDHQPHGHAHVVAAVVAGDGRSVTLTLDTDVELSMLGYSPLNPTNQRETP
jgi:hypothetical protein